MRIALHRPGAIGDVLMSLHLLPALRAQYGADAVVDYVCDRDIGDFLRPVMRLAGVDHVVDCRIAPPPEHYDHVFNLVGYLQPGYPEKPMQRHVLSEWARECGLHNGYLLRNTLPVLPVRGHGPYVTFQVKAGWSKYKEWPLDNWRAVMQALPNIRFVQIGGRDDPRVSESGLHCLGLSIERVASVVGNAVLHVGVDSMGQHLASLFGKRSIVLWGSTQTTGTGYPENINLSAGLPCQPCFRENPAISAMPRGPCLTLPYHACMKALDVETVVAAISSQWLRRDA